jgi:RNA polymerase sigma factor (sigma-70 family)
VQEGGEIMKTSSFEHIVRLQFNSLMMIVMKGILSSHRRQNARRSKHEVVFCELREMKQLEHGMNDSYSYEFVSFQALNFVIRISDEELSTALKELTEKQRSAVLLHFFQGMNDREISELYHVSRSAINSRRDRGLKKLQKLLNERK